VKIDQQAQRSSTQFQVGEKLRFVNGKHSLLRFELYDHCVLDDQVEPITNVDSARVTDASRGARVAAKSVPLCPL
jgi:hypothetical protein